MSPRRRASTPARPAARSTRRPATRSAGRPRAGSPGRPSGSATCPTRSPAGLRTARSYIVGMVVPDVTNPLFPPMVRGAEQVLSRGRLHPRADRHRQRRGDRAPPDRAAAGPRRGRLHHRHRPVGRPAARRDRRRGHPGGAGQPEHRQRAAALRRRATSAPASRSPSTTWSGSGTGGSRTSPGRRTPRPGGSGSARSARRSAATGCQPAAAGPGRARPTPRRPARRRPARLLASGHECTAILAGNDLIAFGVLAVLAEAGISCPDQMSVIGFNDLPLVDKLTPPLTTVRLPLAEMGALRHRSY